MIKIENWSVYGFEEAIRGMRNAMESWENSDSFFVDPFGEIRDINGTSLEKYEEEHGVDGYDIFNATLNGCHIFLGDADLKLMEKLAYNGPVHAKYRRMIIVYVDVTAPLYWWKEFDTYKVGTVSNSCSTMHTIAKKHLTINDFSVDHMYSVYKYLSETLISSINTCIDIYNDCVKKGKTEDAKKTWWQIIQLLPSNYNQKRTIMLNYEVLSNIYTYRNAHKLDEWVEFCKWIKNLPYAKPILFPYSN